jgi:hypothetical protein
VPVHRELKCFEGAFEISGALARGSEIQESRKICRMMVCRLLQHLYSAYDLSAPHCAQRKEIQSFGLIGDFLQQRGVDRFGFIGPPLAYQLTSPSQVAFANDSRH